jgi:hypothetical protein
MKTTIIISFLLLSNTLQAQKDKFETFSIELLHGDETLKYSKIEAFEKDGKYYIKTENFERPEKSVKDSIWITALTKKKYELCRTFIQQINLINTQECKSHSTIFTRYTVSINDTSFTKETYCHLEDLDFYNFRNILFQEKVREYNKLADLEMKKIKKLIKGKWYYPNLTKPLNFLDTLKLSRYEIDKTHFWTFGKRKQFKESSGDVFNLLQSNTYTLFFYYEPRLNIWPGIIENKSNNTSSLANSGMNFEILSISKDELILVRI